MNQRCRRWCGRMRRMWQHEVAIGQEAVSSRRESSRIRRSCPMGFPPAKCVHCRSRLHPFQDSHRRSLIDPCTRWAPRTTYALRRQALHLAHAWPSIPVQDASPRIRLRPGPGRARHAQRANDLPSRDQLEEEAGMNAEVHPRRAMRDSARPQATTGVHPAPAPEGPHARFGKPEPRLMAGPCSRTDQGGQSRSLSALAGTSCR